jgi:hypothetical protein
MGLTFPMQETSFSNFFSRTFFVIRSGKMWTLSEHERR